MVPMTTFPGLRTRASVATRASLPAAASPLRSFRLLLLVCRPPVRIWGIIVSPLQVDPLYPTTDMDDMAGHCNSDSSDP